MEMQDFSGWYLGNTGRHFRRVEEDADMLAPYSIPLPDAKSLRMLSKDNPAANENSKPRIAGAHFFVPYFTEIKGRFPETWPAGAERVLYIPVYSGTQAQRFISEGKNNITSWVITEAHGEQPMAMEGSIDQLLDNFKGSPGGAKVLIVDNGFFPVENFILEKYGNYVNISGANRLIVKP